MYATLGGVDPPGTFHLRLHIDVEHGEDKIEGPLVKAFRHGHLFKLFLEALNVGETLQIGLQLTQRQIGVVGTE